jgi:hypothetical protein
MMTFNAVVYANASDSIQYASQIGRLDFVSALLAIVAIVVGVSALPMFLYLRYRAEDAAKRAIDSQAEILTSRLEDMAVSKMEEMLPILIYEYRDLAKNAEIGDAQADEIADAQEDEKKTV